MRSSLLSVWFQYSPSPSWQALISCDEQGEAATEDCLHCQHESQSLLSLLKAPKHSELCLSRRFLILKEHNRDKTLQHNKGILEHNKIIILRPKYST